MTASPSRRAGSLALSAAAGALFVWLVRRMGASVILDECLVLGRVLPAVLTLSFLTYPLQVAGWRLALPADGRPPWWRSLRATLGGQAVGYLTFAGPVSAEPIRAALLGSQLPMATRIAVGALERTIYAVAGAVVMAVAFLVAGVRLGHHPWPLRLGLGLLILSAVGTWLLARAHRHAPPRAPAAGWRGVLGQLWSDRRPAVAAIALLCLAQHALLISEAYVMLHALGAGPTLATALVFEGVTKTVNSLGAIVPGRLGIAEAGSAAMARALGLGASFGLALALMRRLRALLWSAVGVGLVLPDLWRMSQSASGTSTPPARLESREPHSPLWVPPGPEPGPLAVGWRR